MTDLREAFAPLREDERITDDEIAAVLAAATRAPGRPRRRRAALAIAGATAIAAIVIAALPGADRERRAAPAPIAQDGPSILRAAAAVAAEQPTPPPFTGYRYTEWIDRWTDEIPGRPRLTYEQRVETWIDKRWRGWRVSHQGKVLEGTGTPAGFFYEPSEGEYQYGDSRRSFPEELPTEPTALRKAIVDDILSEKWAPGLPTADELHYYVVRRVLILLGAGNTTPELRAALFEVLARTEGVEAAPDARDALGREGRAVRIPTRRKEGAITVMFDSRTSEMLFWSEAGTGGGTPDQSHTVVRAAQVDDVEQRP